MSFILNQYQQPIGTPLPDWKPGQWPSQLVIEGQYCRLERLTPKTHTLDLYEANTINKDDRNWTYLPYGPFQDLQKFSEWIEDMAAQKDPYFYTVIDLATNKAVGIASLMSIFPEKGSIEIGHINFSPLLQKTIAATETLYLLMNYAFELGYRRLEWKCDHLNEPSRLAARRLGFQFEGTFRQATVYKGRTRDTDWFSILDSEWISLKEAFNKWLDAKNFNNKIQIHSLSDLIKNK